MALTITAVSSTWSYSENVFDGMPDTPASRSVSQVCRRSAAAVSVRPTLVSRPAQNASVAFFNSRRAPIRGYPSTVVSMALSPSNSHHRVPRERQDRTFSGFPLTAHPGPGRSENHPHRQSNDRKLGHQPIDWRNFCAQPQIRSPGRSTAGADSRSDVSIAAPGGQSDPKGPRSGRAGATARESCRYGRRSGCLSGRRPAWSGIGSVPASAVDAARNWASGGVGPHGADHGGQ